MARSLKMGDHIVFRCEEMWRLEAKRGHTGGKGLDDKRWIVLVLRVGRQGG